MWTCPGMPILKWISTTGDKENTWLTGGWNWNPWLW